MNNFTMELGLAADTARMKEYISKFDEEMQKGLRAEASSLRMLPTYIDPDFGSAVEGRAVAVDAGGTNLRVALIEFKKGEPEILYLEKYPIPGTARAVSVREFFDEIAVRLKPVIDRSDCVSFCFSNPAEILASGDARIIGFTKEVKVNDAGGVIIGDALRDALKSRGLPAEKRVFVMNDTTATLLGALADANERKKYGAFAGFIFGTGVNVCYAEKNENILKDPGLCGTPGSTIINTEAGGYDGFPEAEADRRVIEASDDPALQRFEKMSSGAYQCDNLLEWIRIAASKGVFSEGFALRLKGLKRIPVGEAENFCVSPREGGILAGLCVNAADAAKLRLLTEAFFDRIAFMLAIMLTAVLSRMGDAARNADTPVCISAEGAAFRGESFMRERLDRYMDSCARKQLGLYHRFVCVKHATVLGAAVVGLGALGCTDKKKIDISEI
jgi:hexokinase